MNHNGKTTIIEKSFRHFAPLAVDGSRSPPPHYQNHWITGCLFKNRIENKEIKRMNQKNKKYMCPIVFRLFPSHISSRIQLPCGTIFLMRPSYYWSGFAVPNLKQRLIPNKTICCNFILRKSIFKHVIIGERKYVISSLCTLMDIEYGM